MNYKEKLARCTTFCFDVDGVFTDNVVYLTDGGEQMRTANVKDGYAVQLAVKKGFRIAIISGGKNEMVRKRFEGLGVTDIYLGSSEKEKVFDAFLTKYDLDANDVVYMGDDIPDYAVMKRVGLAVAPADAAPEIKGIAHYVSPKNGGQGCVRDVLEQALKVHGYWLDSEGLIW
jgi:3-deoxy-D-manno-octulosonate 8-phosphate phosphatase (KDO 8-P phosphatase)